MAEKAPPIKSKPSDNPKNSADNPAVTPVVFIKTPEQAKASERKKRDSQAHDERELDAQIRAANAAENQIPIGLLAVFLSGAGTLLILWTLLLTRQANTIAEQSANQQLRAYVHPEIIWLSFKGGDPFIDIRARNTGQTPAKWFEIEVTVKVISIKSEVRSVISMTKQKTRWAVIGAGCERIAGVFPENPGNVGLIDFYRTDKNGEFFALGRIRYCDIFDQIWETEFTAFAQPNRGTKKLRDRMVFANSNARAFIAVKA